MSLDWSRLNGGYKTPYDPRPAIEALRADPVAREAWDELWTELHHQGDVGEASYAAVPLVVEVCEQGPRDHNFHGLIATIEVERHRKSNPDLPAVLAERYRAALQRAKQLAFDDLTGSVDTDTAGLALAVIALASGQLKLGTLLQRFDGGDVDGILNENVAWDSVYRDQAT